MGQGLYPVKSPDRSREAAGIPVDFEALIDPSSPGSQKVVKPFTPVYFQVIISFLSCKTCKVVERDEFWAAWVSCSRPAAISSHGNKLAYFECNQPQLTRGNMGGLGLIHGGSGQNT